MPAWKIIQEHDRMSLPALTTIDWELPPIDPVHRWSAVDRSRLIESFLLSLPVLPLYELGISYGKPILLDGAERLRAVRDFYANELTLVGLTCRPDLNGMIRAQLSYAESERLVWSRVELYTIWASPADAEECVGAAIAADDKDHLWAALRARLNTARHFLDDCDRYCKR